MRECHEIFELITRSGRCFSGAQIARSTDLSKAKGVYFVTMSATARSEEKITDVWHTDGYRTPTTESEHL